MRRRRPPYVPQRRRVFLGCEGESERGYGILIRQLLNDQRKDIFLDVVLLKPGGSDPLALLERAERRLVDGRRKGEPPYVCRAILLDADNYDASTHRGRQVTARAAELKIELIWQSPCHEALLLRHLPGCHTLRPPNSTIAIDQLRQHWKEYDKGMPAAHLARTLGLQHFERAVQVEPQLAAFLRQIGFGF